MRSSRLRLRVSTEGFIQSGQGVDVGKTKGPGGEGGVEGLLSAQKVLRGRRNPRREKRSQSCSGVKRKASETKETGRPAGKPSLCLTIEAGNLSSLRPPRSSGIESFAKSSTFQPFLPLSRPLLGFLLPFHSFRSPTLSQSYVTLAREDRRYARNPGVRRNPSKGVSGKKLRTGETVS